MFKCLVIEIGGLQYKMSKCSFCQSNYEIPHGLTLVLNDGNVLHFCSGKCQKNFNLGRKSRKTTWVRKMKHTRAEMIAEIKGDAAEHEEAHKAEEEMKKEAAKAEVEQAEDDKKEEKSEDKKKEEK